MSVVFWLVLWGFFAGVSSQDFFAGFLRRISSQDFFAGFLRRISSQIFFADFLRRFSSRVSSRVSSRECLRGFLRGFLRGSVFAGVSSRGVGVSRSRMNEPKFHVTWRRLTNPCVRAPPHEAKKSQKSRFNPGRSEPKNHTGGRCSGGPHLQCRNSDNGTRHGPTQHPKNSTSLRCSPNRRTRHQRRGRHQAVP